MAGLNSKFLTLYTREQQRLARLQDAVCMAAAMQGASNTRSFSMAATSASSDNTQIWCIDRKELVSRLWLCLHKTWRSEQYSSYSNVRQTHLCWLVAQQDLQLQSGHSPGETHQQTYGMTSRQHHICTGLTAGPMQRVDTAGPMQRVRKSECYNNWIISNWIIKQLKWSCNLYASFTIAAQNLQLSGWSALTIGFWPITQFTLLNVSSQWLQTCTSSDRQS